MEALEDRRSACSVQHLRWEYERTAELQQQLIEQLTQLEGRGLEHLHPQEIDARVMKCDGRGLFAYNAQAVVDHEHDLIVALDVCADQNDLGQLAPMLRCVRRVLGAVARLTVADGGFASGEQLHAVHREGLPVLTPVKSEPSNGQLPKSSFAYDKERDAYVCPRGELLPLEGHNKRDRHATFERAIYRCQATGCPERAICSKDPKGRSIKRMPFEDAVDHQRALMAKPELRNLYELRKEIVEHIFGCIKGNAGFRRFTVRGLARVLAQWALACTSFNLRKLLQTWEAGRFRWDGTQAHP